MTDQALNKSMEKGIAAARQLASEIGISEDRVVEAYEAEVMRLSGSAAVRPFLELLALKHIKTQLAGLRAPRAEEEPTI
jgi:uncharacterized protein YggE